MTNYRCKPLWTVMIILTTALLSIEEAAAEENSILTGTCRDKHGNWLPEGSLCAPPLNWTCQRIGNGPSLTCRAPDNQ